MEHFDHNGWRILTFLPPVDAKELFEKIQSDEFSVDTWLKKHHRSNVGVFRYNGKKLVLKIPEEKNHNKWIQFTTLYRDGEAFRNLKSMHLLSQINIATTTPVLAAEKRKAGMVVKSFLVYEFLDGEECLDNEACYPMVVDKLKEMHQLGYLHGDPQIRNFLLKNNNIYVIDSNPNKTGPLNFSKAYEFAYLRKSAPGIERYFGEIVEWPLYKLAYRYDIYDRKIAALRRRIKRFFSF